MKIISSADADDMLGFLLVTYVDSLAHMWTATALFLKMQHEGTLGHISFEEVGTDNWNIDEM